MCAKPESRWGGRDVVSWRNRHGEIIGVGRPQLLDGNRLALDYWFREHSYGAACNGVVVFECSIRKLEFKQALRYQAIISSKRRVM